MRIIQICVLLGMIVWTGCASSSVTTLRDDTFKSSMVTSLACMPFMKGRRCTEVSSDDNTLLYCTLSAINYPV